MSAPTAERPLRVGLNLLFMGPHAGGAGRYATELPGALLAAEPRTRIDVFVSRAAPPELRQAPWADAVRWVTLPIGASGSRPQLLAQFAGLPLLARARRLDVLHSLANTGPVITPGVASVVSLLDIIKLHRPAEWEGAGGAAMRRQVTHCVRHADRLFAISHAAAEDFVRTLDVARERIEVTPLGVHAPADADTAAGGVVLGEGEGVRAALDLGAQRIVLCVAQKRPYKNLASLIRALGDLDDDVALVLAGARSDHEEELRALAQQLDVAARVRFPDWLADADLQELYRISSLFVLPSLIEGFGIPILEAMAHGTPVACSNVSALPEVAGDAALLFDPENQEQITGAIRRLLDDRELAARLRERGRARVASFTWERTGVASIAGYRRAIAAHRGIAAR